MTDTRRIWITEVHNFGGFFGGDTVTLTAVPWPDGDETTFTIDQKALQNVPDRHAITTEMLLELECVGDRVDQARVLGARDRMVLRQVLGDPPPPETLSGPQVRAYYCQQCDLWLTAPDHALADDDMYCAICGQKLD